MIQRMSWLVVCWCLASSVALAQDAPASRPPTFHASVGLHLAAVIAGHAGTAMLAGGGIQLLDCSYGGIGSSGISGCDAVIGVTITGAVLLGISIALGIAATVVHGDTRAQRERLATTAWPLLWLDAHGGGVGLSLAL